MKCSSFEAPIDCITFYNKSAIYKWGNDISSRFLFCNLFLNYFSHTNKVIEGVYIYIYIYIYIYHTIVNSLYNLWGRGSAQVVLSHAQISEIPQSVAHQTPLSIEFFRQEYWSGLPFPSPGDLPDPGIKPLSSTSPVLTGEFFTIVSTKPIVNLKHLD